MQQYSDQVHCDFFDKLNYFKLRKFDPLSPGRGLLVGRIKIKNSTRRSEGTLGACLYMFYPPNVPKAHKAKNKAIKKLYCVCPDKLLFSPRNIL